MLFETSSITRYLLMLVHALTSVAVALLSIVLGMSIIPISQMTRLLIFMFPFGIPCSIRTLYHFQLAEAAAFPGEEEKDAHHQADVEVAGGCVSTL